MSKVFKSKVLSLLLMTSFISVLFVNPLTLILIPTKAEEYENIDSYNTNPAVRWDQELTTSTETLTTSDGLLTYNDVGIEGQESAYSRRLAKSDFKIEGRLKTPTANKTQQTEYTRAGKLVRDYKFELQDSPSTDSTGNYNGVLGGGIPTYSNDTMNSKKSSYSMKFNSSSEDWLRIAENNDINMCFTDDNDTSSGNDGFFSLDLWLKPTLPMNSSPVFVLDNTVELWLYDDKMQINFNSWAIPSPYEFLAKRYTGMNDFVNTWNNFVWTYDGSNTSAGIKLYINSQLVITTSHSYREAEYLGMALNQAYNTVLGSRSSINTYFYNGYIDEVRVWKNVLLNQTDITTRYSNFVVDDTTVQTIIGITNVDTTLDLDLPELCFIMEPITSNDTGNVLISYGYSSDGIFYSNNFFNISKDIWIRFEIEVDILRSQIEFSFSYDNETDIDDSEQSLIDITSNIVVPDIFTSSVVDVFYGNNFTSNATIEWQLDYIKAPFEEFSFRHSDGDNTAQKGWNPSEFSTRAEVNSSISNSVSYLNVIPNFDSISATLTLYSDDSTANEINTLNARTEILLYNVNQTDGSLIAIMGAQFGFLAPTGYNEILLKDYYEFTGTFPNIVTTSFNQKVSSAMSFYLNPTGTNLIATQSLDGNTLSRSVNVTGLGSEWAVKIIYLYSGTGTDESYFTNTVTDLDLVSRDLFGFLPDMGDPFGISGIFKVIMTPLLVGFRAIGSFFASALSPLSGAIASALSGFFGSLEGVIGILEGAIDSVVSAITDLVDLLIAALVTAVSDVFDEILDWVIATAVDLADFINDLLWLTWDLVVTNTFLNDIITPLGLIWDLFMTAIDGLTEILLLAVDIVTFITDYAFFLYLVYTFVLFLAVVVPSDLFRNMSADISRGTSMFGFSLFIPAGIIWLALTIYWWSTYN